MTSRADRLQALLDKHLSSGAEPYVLVETTLQNLRALRVVQIVQSLAPTHPCFANGRNSIIEGMGDAGPSITAKYADADPLTSIRVSMVPVRSNAATIKKTDVVIGNGQVLMSGLVENQIMPNGEQGRISITFPANGMIFGDLRKGIVRVCNDFAGEAQGWAAESIIVEVSKGGGTFETFRLWNNVPFPPGKSSSVTFRGDQNVSGRARGAQVPGINYRPTVFVLSMANY